MDPITLAALALGSVVLLGGKKKRSSSSVKSGTTTSGAGPRAWVAETNEERSRWLHEIESMSRWVSDKYGTMPYLSDFLVITSFRGARFNPAMVNSPSPNSARGLFDMRPDTVAQYIPAIGVDPSLLNNPYISFVVSIQHIIRAVSKVNQRGSGVADWISIRRWWAYPYLVHDFDESEPKSKQVRGRMLVDVDDCNEHWGTNIDPNFWDADVDIGKYPPTTEELMRDFSQIGAQV
jgi:hypothetical protein